ncbi:MAG: RHS repeat-associated core domain-containing protein, partial [Betaproteobacteria bacterium]
MVCLPTLNQQIGSATTTSSLTSILHPKVTQTFNANGHLTVKTVTPEDTSPAGLQAGKQSQRYTYSVSERLLRISDGSGVANTTNTANNTNNANNANNEQGNEIARYAYDPFGRRIKKTVSQNPSGQGGTGTTLYFYADEGLIAEVDGSPTTNGGNITTSYGWMPASANTGTWGTAPQWKRDHAGQSGATDVQGSANTNGITHYVHVDHLGTSQRLTNTQGETTWRAVSEAFGKTFIDTTLAPATTGTTTNNLRFPGQYEDQETATHYNYMRTYLPNVGRYGESDPSGLIGGSNTYRYVTSPLRSSDSRGLVSPSDLSAADYFLMSYFFFGARQNGGDVLDISWACGAYLEDPNIKEHRTNVEYAIAEKTKGFAGSLSTGSIVREREYRKTSLHITKIFSFGLPRTRQ